MNFFSDNTATACPEVLEALGQANQGSVKAYGDDAWTQRLDAVLGEYFGTKVAAFVVTTGTAANALSLATVAPPYGAVYAHEAAHVVHDECGAVEFFSGGARVTSVPGPNGKLTAQTLQAMLDSNGISVHQLQPAAVTVTQATEFGTVYRPDELKVLTAVAHSRKLRVHMDGARFANAVAYLNCHPGDVTWRAGIDVLSFGATKNGAIAAEAVVFFNLDCVKDFELRRKRAGHLISKSRYVSAQLLAYVESGAWLRNAQRANSLAQRIAQAAGNRLLYPVEANELFLKLGDANKKALRDAGFRFYDWAAPASGEARLVVSWDQPEESVTALCKALANLS
jgi:threonine aldolase